MCPIPAQGRENYGGMYANKNSEIGRGDPDSAIGIYISIPTALV